ncbi:small G protein signaling modulator 1-like isoform X1 [Papaver somniferum]|uniref:small G protein signaling modulator 1-like isoform X1 n=1 Tax=Papaver somniferum TaxID=3469 RepID=UPI000E70049E|nr:small G protein signaling modulator 1-like isoform X1 [Papaver somniferum]
MSDIIEGGKESTKENNNNKQWGCGGKSGTIVNLQRVSSIVKDIGEPCLHQSPTKIVRSKQRTIQRDIKCSFGQLNYLKNRLRKLKIFASSCLPCRSRIMSSKMLRPDKWRATFDSDGKVFGFRKALKLIVLGGVDPSIRAEVWEFLLGCYALSSTSEHRRQLRMARREKYKDLIKQCQKMHSSIGTGSLAYVVGSKVMDVRTLSKDSGTREAEPESISASHDAANVAETSDQNNNCTSTSHVCQRESSINSAELLSVRGSKDSAAYDSSRAMGSLDPPNCVSPKAGREVHVSHDDTDSYFDFPHLPVTDLFDRSDSDKNEFRGNDDDRLSSEEKLDLVDENMHSFQINNNVELFLESSGLHSDDVSHASESEHGSFGSDSHKQVIQSRNFEHESEINRLRISDVPETAVMSSTTSAGERASEERVSEWLWTLHRIVVDVVRTDSHLEFYEDAKNMARMSDILAVYAWVDPGTGYCQGMSDLLSPFVVLYDDNADAFWCFEMLLRRMRENFQMEGPTGVMKQLESLWRILELTDKETFSHLSLIGAESLHFAFRMLLVLFRRELSFNEALCMWEMMWAADFDESVARDLEENCLEPLIVQLPRYSSSETAEASVKSNGSSKTAEESVKSIGSSKGDRPQPITGSVEHSVSNDSGMKAEASYPFCGLTRSFWSKNDRMQNCTIISSTRNGDDELPVFCAAAILVINRHKIIKETRSIDDLIKIFNDNLLDINVTRCVRTAIKLRKKYFYKIIRHKRTGSNPENI